MQGFCFACPAKRKNVQRNVRLHQPTGRLYCLQCWHRLFHFGVCSLCGGSKAVRKQRKTGKMRCETCRRKASVPPVGDCSECPRKNVTLPNIGQSGRICVRCNLRNHPSPRKMGICPVCLPKNPRWIRYRLADGRLVCSSCYMWTRKPRRCTECGKKFKRLFRFKSGRTVSKGRRVCFSCLRKLSTRPLQKSARSTAPLDHG